MPSKTKESPNFSACEGRVNPGEAVTTRSSRALFCALLKRFCPRKLKLSCDLPGDSAATQGHLADHQAGGCHLEPFHSGLVGLSAREETTSENDMVPADRKTLPGITGLGIITALVLVPESSRKNSTAPFADVLTSQLHEGVSCAYKRQAPGGNLYFSDLYPTLSRSSATWSLWAMTRSADTALALGFGPSALVFLPFLPARLLKYRLFVQPPNTAAPQGPAPSCSSTVPPASRAL